MAMTWVYVHGAAVMPAEMITNPTSARELENRLLASPGLGDVEDPRETGTQSGKKCDIPVVDFDSYTYFYAALPTPITVAGVDLAFDTLQIDFVTGNGGLLNEVALFQGGDFVPVWERSLAVRGTSGVAESQTLELGTWSEVGPERVYTRQGARNGTLVWMKFTALPPPNVTAYAIFYDLGIGFSDEWTTTEIPFIEPLRP
jgi:hypothetical protein